MDTERLSTLDEFGSRKFVIPAEVEGPFRKWRTRVYWPLLIIFLAVPWITIHGVHVLMLDFPNRHFEILGQIFLAHDSPLVFLISAFLVLMLAFVTAVWGRVWCGWACPQTVFIDTVYRKIEILIEGDYKIRRRRRQDGLTFSSAMRSTVKWSCYFVVSSIFAHSFIALFTGGTNLLGMMGHSPSENWPYFLSVSVSTALLMFNFGWFREQFCIIMCPYGRFQSVLMDARSLTVAYNQTRGEPRKSPTVPAEKRGDCVSCNRCVEVCPTGIDIRNGSQMECIGCTACIDACNVIMKKVNKQPDLISYRSESGSQVSRILQPRPLAYLVLSLACLIGFSFAFIGRAPFAVSILRAKDSPYQTLADEQIMNHFKAHVLNQSNESMQISISLPPEFAEAGVKLTQQQASQRLNSGSSIEMHFFLTFPKSFIEPSGKSTIYVEVERSDQTLPTKREVTLVGPASSI